MGPFIPVVATALVATFWPRETGKDRLPKPTARPAESRPKGIAKPAKPVISAPVEKPSKYSVSAKPAGWMGILNDRAGGVDLLVKISCSPAVYGPANEVVFPIRIMSPSGNEEALSEYMFTRSGSQYETHASRAIFIKLPPGKHKAVMTFCVGEHDGTKITDSNGMCAKFVHVDCAKSDVELASVEFTTQ